jgi:hypothetical protein
MKQTFPIIFIHIDDSDYLKYTLAQAKISSPNAIIHLIGDQFNDNYEFVTHHNIKNYSSEAELFSKLYKHHSTNSYSAEIFCFRRWFVLKEFMEDNDLTRCLYLDSDVLLYADILEEHLMYNNYSFTIVNGMSPNFTLINDRKMLEDFCDFIVKCFISDALYKRLAETAVHNLWSDGCVSDMVAFYEYQKTSPYNIGDASAIGHQSGHDLNMNLSEGLEMEEGVKKIYWIDNKPYCRDISSGSLIKLNSLHFQAGAKRLIRDNFRGKLDYSEERKKWSIQNQDIVLPPDTTPSSDAEKRISHDNSLTPGDTENIGILLSSANPAEEQNKIEQAIEKYQLSPELLTLYGELKLRNNYREDAQKILSYVMARWPDYDRASKSLEYATFQENRWDYASNLMENALKLDPEAVWKIVLIEKIMTLIPVDTTILSLIEKVDGLIKNNDYENARETLSDILFELAYLQIREPKRKGYPPTLDISNDKIMHNLLELGFSINDYAINIGDYRKYFHSGQYTNKFPDYYPYNLTEKSLEHYIAAQLLDINEKDIYIDIASAGSPAPIIYRDLFGAETFRQDIAYAPGLSIDLIGGKASKMPLPDAFATKMGLHGSFEHFEDDSDTEFINEAGRVLKPGGSICIVPLHLAQEYSIVTDPVLAATQNIAFENRAVVCCVKGFNNRFCRFYDPVNLKSRIQDNLGSLSLKIFRITNANIDPSCYVQFAAFLQKPVT